MIITGFKFKDLDSMDIDMAQYILNEAIGAITNLPEGIFGYDIKALQKLNNMDSYFAIEDCSYRNVLINNLNGVQNMLERMKTKDQEK